jgi:hypothetical protein
LSIETGVNLSMNKLANLTFDHDLPRIRGDPRISALDLHFSAGKVYFY